MCLGELMKRFDERTLIFAFSVMVAVGVAARLSSREPAPEIAAVVEPTNEAQPPPRAASESRTSTLALRSPQPPANAPPATVPHVVTVQTGVADEEHSAADPDLEALVQQGPPNQRVGRRHS
jgi:hypothetical protein